MTNGDMIDCVDMYQQPAFEHPLLRNHTIEMRPSFKTYVHERANNSQYADLTSEQSCPIGTIPIIKANESRPREFDGVVFGEAPEEGIRFARAKMLRPTNTNLVGVSADLSVCAPLVQTGEDSLAVVGINNEDQSVFISAGWAPRSIILVHVGSIIIRCCSYPMSTLLVNKNVYFIITQVKNGTTKFGCLNLQCPGFVQVNESFVLGGNWLHRNMSVIHVQIYKDVNQRRWLIKFNDIDVGYWSFDAQNFDTAKYAVCVGSISSQGPSPQPLAQMGSGLFSSEGFGNAAHFGNMLYFGEDGIGRAAKEVDTFATRPDCYNLQLFPQTPGNIAPMVLYGGPGAWNCF